MEVIAIENAKLVSLFFVARQGAQPPIPQMAEAFVRRYEFAKFPTKIEELVSDKIEFAYGMFNGARIDLLEVYSDGIVVTTKAPSDVIDAFVEDVLAWAGTDFGMKRIETQKNNKIYESHLVIKSDKKLLKGLDLFPGLSARLKKHLLSASKIETEMETVGFSIGCDVTEIAGLKPIPFRLERRVGVAFESNLYYSGAPLRTQDHISLLEHLESSL